MIATIAFSAVLIVLCSDVRAILLQRSQFENGPHEENFIKTSKIMLFFNIYFSNDL